MRLIDYLLLAIVAVCAVIAWRVWHRAMKKKKTRKQGRPRPTGKSIRI